MQKRILNHNITCFGEVLWDNLPSGRKLGGAPLNVAVHLLKHNINVFMVSKVGRDKLGKAIIKSMKELGLNTEYIQIDDKLPTSEVLVSLDVQGKPSYEICEPVAWDNINNSTAINELVERSGIVVYGTLASRNQETRNTLLSILDHSKSLKIIDVNLRYPFDNQEVVDLLLRKSDIIKLNDDELQLISTWYNANVDNNEMERLRWFSDEFNCDFICLTKGDKGAYVYDNGAIIRHNGYQVKVADSVGAGDAFLAGFISSILSEQPIEQALDFACANGAFVASCEGATPDYSLIDIEKIKSSAII